MRKLLTTAAATGFRAIVVLRDQSLREGEPSNRTSGFVQAADRRTPNVNLSWRAGRTKLRAEPGDGARSEGGPPRDGRRRIALRCLDGGNELGGWSDIGLLQCVVELRELADATAECRCAAAAATFERPGLAIQ